MLSGLARVGVVLVLGVVVRALRAVIGWPPERTDRCEPGGRVLLPHGRWLCIDCAHTNEPEDPCCRRCGSSLELRA